MGAMTTSTAATPAPTVAVTPKASGAVVQIVQPNPGALSWAYNPQTLTVKAGDQVTWTNTGSLAHTVTADDGSFDSGNLNPGDTWSFTFSKPGTYAYHCAPHPWMKATIVVQ
jgi:plastocyanin